MIFITETMDRRRAFRLGRRLLPLPRQGAKSFRLRYGNIGFLRRKSRVVRPDIRSVFRFRPFGDIQKMESEYADMDPETLTILC